MYKCRGVLIFSACLCILATALNGYADEDYEDLVDIIEVENKIYAIVSSGKKFTFDLERRESVQWLNTRGYLAAFLTNLRFVVISYKSDDWQIAPLKLSESKNNVPGLSPTLALLTTEDRAIVFDARSQRFVEKQFPLRDDLLAAEIGEQIAIVVTSSRAFGVASGSSSFAQVHLKLNETIEDIKISSNRATVRTQDRLLTFLGRNASWLAHKLD